VFTHQPVVPFVLALLQLVLHVAFHGNYGYFRDELYYIACSDHLSFGFVDQPPLSIAILWITRGILGDSLHALRFLPALAGAGVVLLAAAMARRLGGARLAQGLAALSVFAAHGLLGQGRTFSMNPFDILFWTLSGYLLIVLFGSDRPKLWIPLGSIIGLGLLNKYSIGFMVIGLATGMLLSRQRRQFLTPWPWLGAAIAALVFLPHVVWQVANGFPSLEFMRNASQNKNVSLGVLGFLGGQFRDMNIFNAPLWLAGIVFFFTHADGRYRPLGWLYPVVFLVMVAGNAKVYYLSAIYPLLLAGGAVLFEQRIHQRIRAWLTPVYAGLLILLSAAILPFALPVLPVGSFVAYEKLTGLTPRAEERSAVAELPQYYADQFGWREMVDSVARVYRSLSPEERSRCFIYVRNYGEAAAIDFFGKPLGLPRASCAHNSYWYWGPGEQTGDISIIFGNSRDPGESFADLRRGWTHVELVTKTQARYAMPYENGRLIFLCKGMNTTFQKLWASERFFI